MKTTFKDYLLEEYEWDKSNVAGEPVTPNRIVYHVSTSDKRMGIMRGGFKTKVGESYSSWSQGKKAIPAVFATNSKFEDHADIWSINTQLCDNKWFVDAHFNNMSFHNPHIVTFEDIQKKAIN